MSRKEVTITSDKASTITQVVLHPEVIKIRSQTLQSKESKYMEEK